MYRIGNNGYINKKMGFSTIFIPPSYNSNKIRIEGYNLYLKRTNYGFIAYGSEKNNNIVTKYYFYYDYIGFLKRIKIDQNGKNMYIILSSWNSPFIKPYAFRWKNKKIKLSYEAYCCTKENPEKIGEIEYTIEKVHGFLTVLNESIKLRGESYNKLWFIDTDTGEDIINSKYGSIGLWVPRIQEKMLILGVVLKRVPTNETIYQYEGYTLDAQGNKVKMIYLYNASGFLIQIEVSTISKNGTLVSEAIKYTNKSKQKEGIIYGKEFMYTSLILVFVAVGLYIYGFVIRRKVEDIEKIIVILIVLSSIIALFMRDEHTWVAITFSTIVIMLIKLLIGERLHV